MKVKAIALALAVGAGVLAFGVGTASATETYYPTAGWKLRDICIGGDWTEQAHDSKIVNPTTVDLTRGSEQGKCGTSLETDNLNLPVESGDKVTVDYELKLNANPASGAIRMFVYDKPNAETNADGEAPKVFVAVANTNSGTLEIPIDSSWTIGTAGLTYDASNDIVPGTVTFKNLKVNDNLVLFLEPEPETSESGSTSAPATTSESTNPVANNDTLPVTGTDIKTIGILGAVLFVIGGVAIIVGRKRRETE